MGVTERWLRSGGRSTINDERKDDERGIVLTALSVGIPAGRNQGFKVAYIRSRTTEDTGSDTDTFALAWSIRF